MTPADFVPYIPWLIGCGLIVALAGTLGWIHLTRLRIRHGYPLEGMWGQSLKPELTSAAMDSMRREEGETGDREDEAEDQNEVGVHQLASFTSRRRSISLVRW